MPQVGLSILVAAIGVLVYLFAVQTPVGLALDGRVFATASRVPGLSDPVGDALHSLMVPVLVLGSAAVIVLAIRSRRLTAASLAMLAGFLATVTAELLKVILPGRPGDPTAPLSSPLDLLDPAWWARVHDGPVILSGSFPSGHATVATGLALALLTALTPWLARRLALPVLALALAASAATVLAGWHRPSDAVGGVLLALAWWLALAPSAVLHETRLKPSSLVNPGLGSAGRDGWAGHGAPPVATGGRREGPR